MWEHRLASHSRAGRRGTTYFWIRDVAVIAGIPISAGSLAFLSILLKFALTVSAALLLIATTSFPGVCHALRRLGLPPALRKISPCGRNDAGGVFSKWLKKGSSDLIVLV